MTWRRSVVETAIAVIDIALINCHLWQGGLLLWSNGVFSFFALEMTEISHGFLPRLCLCLFDSLALLFTDELCDTLVNHVTTVFL